MQTYQFRIKYKYLETSFPFFMESIIFHVSSLSQITSCSKCLRLNLFWLNCFSLWRVSDVLCDQRVKENKITV